MLIAVVMILRIWAMYYRSRPILYTLLALLAVEIVCIFLSLVFALPSGT